MRELAALVEAGMTPMAAIEAATRVNAELLGRADELGTIEPGKLADPKSDNRLAGIPPLARSSRRAAQVARPPDSHRAP